MREELEAALERDFSRANLTVYADYLQSIGDPRGDWIAMDLALLRDGARAAPQEAREEVLRRFRGGVLGSEVLRYGFVDQVHNRLYSNDGRDDLSDDDRASAVLDGPLGPYIRAIGITTIRERIADDVAAIAAVRRPWLHRITLHVPHAGEVELDGVLAPELLARVAAASPALRLVELRNARLASWPGATVVPFREGVHRFSRAMFEVPDEPVQHVELGRLARLHGGTVDDMDDRARDAWADLRLCLEHIEDGRGGAASGVPFPAATLRTVIGSIDFALYYGSDWAEIAAQLARHPGCATVLLGRM